MPTMMRFVMSTGQAWIISPYTAVMMAPPTDTSRSGTMRRMVNDSTTRTLPA